MFRKILLCYDGTVEGRNALRDGADVALCMQAETHLLAILRELHPGLVPEGVSASLFAQQEKEATRILREGVNWLQEHGLNARGHIAYGNPIHHIHDTARRIQADLIVVGHRKRSRLARWWSDAEDATLLDRACCSILVSIAPGAG